MGWAHCGTDDTGREIGYGIAAVCDQPGCAAEIDRGLSYVCGGMHGGDGIGCGRYFCPEHLFLGGRDQLCAACVAAEPEVDDVVTMDTTRVLATAEAAAEWDAMLRPPARPMYDVPD